MAARKAAPKRQLDRLVKLGLANRNEYTDASGKIDKNAADRIRRLYNKTTGKGKLARYVRSSRYQFVRIRDPKRRKAARLASPRELRRLDLPGVFVRTDLIRSPDGGIVTDSIRSVNPRADGSVRVKLKSGRALTYLPVSRADLARNPRKAAQRAVDRFGAPGSDDLWRLNTGPFGTGPLSQLSGAALFPGSIEATLNKYLDVQVRGYEESVEGIVIEERPQKARRRKKAARKKAARKKAARKKAARKKAARKKATPKSAARKRRRKGTR